MKTIRENMGGIITCFIEVLVGILLLVDPMGFTAGIIIALGALLMLAGIVRVIRYFRIDAGQAALEQSLALGLVYIIAGLFCVLNYKWFIVTFPVLTVLYGIVNLVSGLFKLQFTVDAIRMKARWGWTAFGAAVTLVFAVTILLNPFSSTIFLWTFTAVTLIIEAALDLLSIILVSRQKKENVCE